MPPARSADAARWIQGILHIHDTPRRTAAAFGLGVVIGFSPFLGIHTAMGIILAFSLGLNRVAVLAGVWLNLPWFVGPYYAAATALGAWLTGTDMPPHFLSQLQDIWELAGWRDRATTLGQLLRPLLLPYTVGSTLASLVMGTMAYRLTLPVLLSRQRALQSQP